MKLLTVIIALYSLAGCSSVAPQSENSAERYCRQKGGELIYEKQLFGRTEYCQLPDGTWIEDWRLYLKDHVLP